MSTSRSTARRSLRPRALRTRALLGVVTWICAGTAWSQDFANTTLQTEHVAGNIHVVISGIAGNIGVSAGEDGILIVDDQYAPLADKIRQSLAEISPGELEFVINTHWHQDHAGGNEVFGQVATILAHRNVRTRIAAAAERAGRQDTPEAKAALPVLTYEEGVTVHWNGEDIVVEHLPPGHTDGDSIVWFTGSNVLHMGDDFFADRFPYVDVSSGGSPQGLADNIGRVLKELPPGVRIIPGHGPVTDAAGLERFHTMLVDTIATVRQAKAAGKTLPEIQKAGFGDRFASWSWSFITTERWAEILYQGL